MNSKNTKRALVSSALAMLVCVAMLIGTTFAWFTDTASTSVNKIQSGSLDVDIVDANNVHIDTLNFIKAEGGKDEAILWEPGCTYNLTPFKIVNNGTLALKYKVVVSGAVGDTDLLDVIDFSYTTEDGTFDINAEGHLGAGASTKLITMSGKMQETAGNDYMGKEVTGITITVVATQDTVENDSYNNTYDANAGYPVTGHADMQKAFAEGGRFSVSSNITADETKTEAADRLVVKAPTTLDMGAVYTVPGELEDSNNWAALFIAADTTINASENAGIMCLDKTDPKYSYTGGPYVAHIAKEGITVTVNGGKYYAGGTVFNVQAGTLVVNGGFFECAPDIGTHDYRYLLNCIDENYKNGTADIIVKGGTFVNFDPSDNVAEGAGTNFVADGYKVVSETQSNGDIWYTVVAE